jgi:predicted amidophosphoribosyltransferase
MKSRRDAQAAEQQKESKAKKQMKSRSDAQGCRRKGKPRSKPESVCINALETMHLLTTIFILSSVHFLSLPWMSQLKFQKHHLWNKDLQNLNLTGLILNVLKLTKTSSEA